MPNHTQNLTQSEEFRVRFGTRILALTVTTPPSLYSRLLLPRLIDCACGLGVVSRQRARVVPRAHGRVLEIGIGTGLNLAHYDAGRVTGIVGVDPGVEMHPLALRRAREAGLAVELMPLSAETLPAPDASFDSIVCTYSLCTIPDPAAAGFTAQMHSRYLHRPHFAGYHYWGWAGRG